MFVYFFYESRGKGMGRALHHYAVSLPHSSRSTFKGNSDASSII